MELCGELKTVDMLLYGKKKHRSRRYICAAARCHCSDVYNPAGVSHFQFPADDNRCKEWLHRVGRLDLLRVQDLKSRHKVCGLHFNDDDFMSPQRNRLKSSALPHMQDLRLVDHDYAKLTFEVDTAPQPAPRRVMPKVHVRVGGQPHQPQPSETVLNSGSISNLTLPVKISNADSSDTKWPAEVSNAETHHSDTTSNETPKPDKVMIMSEHWRRCRKFYQKISRLKRRNMLLTKTFQELRKKRELSTVDDVLMLASKYLNDSTLSLFETQLRNGKCGNKARRWTSKDQSFALALYRTSPRAYALLRKFLVLPSLSTIANWKHETNST